MRNTTGSPNEALLWMILGIAISSIAGSGLLLVMFHQPTTANIHSGYAWQSPFEWLQLTFVGALCALPLGTVLGRLARWKVVVRALLLVTLIAGISGHVITERRPVIDCDYDSGPCSDPSKYP